MDLAFVYDEWLSFLTMLGQAKKAVLSRRKEQRQYGEIIIHLMFLNDLLYVFCSHNIALANSSWR